MKPITGTFLDEITWDIPSQNWGRKEWRKEFDTMKAAGIDTVIIIRCGLRNMMAYPSQATGIKDVPDLAQLFLDEARRCRIKLFFGCYDSGTLNYQFDNWKTDWAINQKVLPEILNRYGDHPAFCGWYLAQESCVCTEGTLEIYARISNRMKELSPQWPVLISPYYPSSAYGNDTKEVRHKKFVGDWRRIFRAARAIDICAFQDGSCNFNAPGFPTSELDDYVREVHEILREFKITMWNNVETFGRDLPIKFPPIDWRILKHKMAIADPYAVKHITFEFSHFLSPNSMWPSARMLYQRYREEILGEKPRKGSARTNAPRRRS
ncbi:MAG: DUF4434 domain-containing protein [bacterium]